MKIEVQGGPGKARRRIDGFAWLAALIAATGAGYLWLRASTWGLALNNDGVMYLAVAESLAAGAGLVYANNRALLYYSGGARAPIIRVRYPAEQVHDCQAYLRRAVAQARREARSPEATWIVWINRQAQRKNWCNIPEGQLPPQLEAVASFASGAVFRLQPR